MTEREILLKKISTYQFAMLDLQLFLNTHPGDSETAEQVETYRAMLKPLVDEYEKNTARSQRTPPRATNGAGSRLRGLGKAGRTADVCL